VQVCDVVHFTTGRLEVTITARDTQGHLRGYSLNALSGHNQATPLPPGGAEDYSTHINPTRQWAGGVFGTGVMPTCAYEFRLGVSKRTTDGYRLLYSGLEDTKHLTLQR
jgi:hypothetical protein